MKSQVIVGALIGGGVLAVILIIFITSGFSYLHYYELGFKRKTTTGFIYTDEVYTSGRHFMGPLIDFKTYPADAHFVTLHRLSVFTKKKLAVEIDVYFQYFLRPEQLKWLHKDHERAYDSVIRKRAVSAMKDATMQFDTDLFIRNRTIIENTLFKSVSERLGGACCPRQCKNFGRAGCPTGCVPYASCSKEQSGIYVDVRYFFLGTMYLPYKLSEKYLKALTVQVEKETEVHLQREQVVRKQIDEEVQTVNNKVNEELNKANTKAKLIREQAQAKAKQQVGLSHINGSKALIERVGVSAAQRMSVHYLYALQQMPLAHYAIDFTQLMLMAKP